MHNADADYRLCYSVILTLTGMALWTADFGKFNDLGSDELTRLLKISAIIQGGMGKIRTVKEETLLSFFSCRNSNSFQSWMSVVVWFYYRNVEFACLEVTLLVKLDLEVLYVIFHWLPNG